MRHLVRGRKLGRKASHRKATLMALSVALIKNERIVTTLSKAKALRSFVEPIITRSKEDNTHNRSHVFRHLRDKKVTSRLFDEIAPMVDERPGGYTRIIKLGTRSGDGVEQAMIELVDFNDVKPEMPGKKKRRRRTRRGRTRSREKTPTAKAEDVKAPAAQAEDAKAEDVKAPAAQAEDAKADDVKAPAAQAEDAKADVEKPESKETDDSGKLTDKKEHGAEKQSDKETVGHEPSPESITAPDEADSGKGKENTIQEDLSDTDSEQEPKESADEK